MFWLDDMYLYMSMVYFYIFVWKEKDFILVNEKKSLASCKVALFRRRKISPIHVSNFYRIPHVSRYSYMLGNAYSQCSITDICLLTFSSIYGGYFKI